MQQLCNRRPRYGVVRLILIIIRYVYVCIFIPWPMYLLVHSSYCMYIKAGLPQLQQLMFYLYQQLLQLWGVHTCGHVYTWTSESITRFTLYNCFNEKHTCKWILFFAILIFHDCIMKYHWVLRKSKETAGRLIIKWNWKWWHVLFISREQSRSWDLARPDSASLTS